MIRAAVTRSKTKANESPFFESVKSVHIDRGNQKKKKKKRNGAKGKKTNKMFQCHFSDSAQKDGERTRQKKTKLISTSALDEAGATRRRPMERQDPNSPTIRRDAIGRRRGPLATRSSIETPRPFFLLFYFFFFSLARFIILSFLEDSVPNENMCTALNERPN